MKYTYDDLLNTITDMLAEADGVTITNVYETLTGDYLTYDSEDDTWTD